LQKIQVDYIRKNKKEFIDKWNEKQKPEPLTAVLQMRGVLCCYESEVLNSRFVHIMKFSAKNPRLRKAAKR
jgi:hypothetical protein